MFIGTQPYEVDNTGVKLSSPCVRIIGLFHNREDRANRIYNSQDPDFQEEPGTLIVQIKIFNSKEDMAAKKKPATAIEPFRFACTVDEYKACGNPYEYAYGLLKEEFAKPELFGAGNIEDYIV